APRSESAVRIASGERMSRRQRRLIAVNVTGPASSGGLAGLDARALRLLAETLIEEAAREPSRADDRAPAPAAPPADRLSVSFDALTAAPLQQLLQTIEQQLFPSSISFE